MRRPDYRAIWPLRGPVKRCTLCRKAPADVFVSLRDGPIGEPRQHYMCGACLYNHLLTALNVKLEQWEYDKLHVYLSSTDESRHESTEYAEWNTTGQE